MLENILVGVMAVIILAAAIFAWRYENGNSGIIEEHEEQNDLERKDEKS